MDQFSLLDLSLRDDNDNLLTHLRPSIANGAELMRMHGGASAVTVGGSSHNIVKSFEAATTTATGSATTSTMTTATATATLVVAAHATSAVSAADRANIIRTSSAILSSFSPEDDVVERDHGDKPNAAPPAKRPISKTIPAKIQGT